VSLAVACSGGGTTVVPPRDGGSVVAEDGGTALEDGGGAQTDGGTALEDGGAIETDGGAMVTDPCNGVSDEGRCASSTSVELCEITSEGGRPRLLTQNCQAGETCQVGAQGKATCVLTAACRNDDVECQDASTLRTCTNNAWVPTNCPNGCVNAPVGATCAAGGTTQTLSGRVVFERRDINPDRSALGDLFDVPARGFTVTAHRGSALIGTTTTSTTDGSFSVVAPNPLQSGDVVRVAAIANEGASIAYVIADPNLPAGMQNTNQAYSVTSPRVWSFEFPAAEVGANPLRIRNTSSASQVANVFDKFGVTYREMKTRYGRPGAPIMIWMGNGVAWDCGACVGDGDVTFFGTRFQQQMWYPADSNESAFSDPVIQHEAGHWVMSAFGRSPGEGGGHSVQCLSFPGLAWSDGFATWLGQAMVGNPIYFDIQGGLFWYDVAARSYNGDSARWPTRPTPNAPDVGTSSAPGLLQKISEGEVTAILYALSNGPADPGPILQALGSPRMTEPNSQGRFERGYTRRLWEFNIEGCRDSGVRDVGEIAPILPDLLDAMLCAGFPSARLDAATRPTEFYPFPSNSPLCR
jgi:hypothetical protein